MYYLKRRIIKDHPRTRRTKKAIIADSVKLDGMYRMFSIKNGIKTKVGEEHNTIMDYCLGVVAQAFVGYCLSPFVSIKYVAIGDDNTATVGTEETLYNEVYRTRYVARSYSGPVASGTFYITDTDFSGDIEEMGIFGGNSAVEATDSGGLLSRVLWSYTKSPSEEVVIEYDLTIS